MAIKEIIVWPSESLLSECSDVDTLVHIDNVDILVEDLIDTMRDNNGVGLAAPQIGSDKNVCVLDMEKIYKADGIDKDRRDIKEVLVMIYIKYIYEFT